MKTTYWRPLRQARGTLAMLAMRCARGRPFKHRGYLEVSPAALGVTD
jgi:hypothetical protein